MGVVPWQIVTEASLQNSFQITLRIGSVERRWARGCVNYIWSRRRGFSALGYPSRPVTIKGKHAAAVGQSLLMQAYTEEFRKYGIVTAQLLLTRSDFSRKEQYSNAYATLGELLNRSALPIINENDSISLEELTFGDNDMLSALVSGLVSADMLMIFTDVNGLYDKNPQKNPDAKILFSS